MIKRSPEPPKLGIVVRDLARDLGTLGDQAGDDMRHYHAAMVESGTARPLASAR